MREPWRGVVWMQRFAAGLFLALFGAFAAVADDGGRRLTVQGTGVVLAVPDMASVRVGVTTRAASAVDAVHENSEKTGALIGRLSELGVAVEDLQTASVSLFPEFERLTRRQDGAGQKDGPPRITGYRAANSVAVTVRDLGTLGMLLDAVVQAGATDIGGITFQLTEIERLKDDALALAMGRAKEKAARLSAAAGVELGQIVVVTEQLAGGPGPVLAVRAFAESAVPIAPGRRRIEASVNVTFLLAD